jgi:hypothetical protein
VGTEVEQINIPDADSVSTVSDDEQAAPLAKKDSGYHSTELSPDHSDGEQEVTKDLCLLAESNDTRTSEPAKRTKAEKRRICKKKRKAAKAVQVTEQIAAKKKRPPRNQTGESNYRIVHEPSLRDDDMLVSITRMLNNHALDVIRRDMEAAASKKSPGIADTSFIPDGSAVASNDTTFGSEIDGPSLSSSLTSPTGASLVAVPPDIHVTTRSIPSPSYLKSDTGFSTALEAYHAPKPGLKIGDKSVDKVGDGDNVKVTAVPSRDTKPTPPGASCPAPAPQSSLSPDIATRHLSSTKSTQKLTTSTTRGCLSCLPGWASPASILKPVISSQIFSMAKAVFRQVDPTELD